MGTASSIMQPLVIALFLAGVANRLVEGLIVPFWEQVHWDKFYLLYVAWLVGGLLVAVSQVNLFAAYIPDPIVGQLLTALVAGGGANLLHDLFDQAPGVSVQVDPAPPVDAGFITSWRK